MVDSGGDGRGRDLDGGLCGDGVLELLPTLFALAQIILDHQISFDTEALGIRVRFRDKLGEFRKLAGETRRGA